MEKFSWPFAPSAGFGNKSKTRKLKLYGHFRWFLWIPEKQTNNFRFNVCVGNI